MENIRRIHEIYEARFGSKDRLEHGQRAEIITNEKDVVGMIYYAMPNVPSGSHSLMFSITPENELVIRDDNVSKWHPEVGEFLRKIQLTKGEFRFGTRQRMEYRTDAAALAKRLGVEAKPLPLLQKIFNELRLGHATLNR